MAIVILRNVIPAEELDAMREASEAILDRQREIWRREAGPDDPPGGVWDTRAAAASFGHGALG